MKRTVFFDDLAEKVASLGGYHNAHLHLDRYATLKELLVDGRENEAGLLTLSEKHGLITALHTSAYYQTAFLQQRLQTGLDSLVACHTRRADSVIDVTNDGLGLRGLDIALGLAEDYRDRIEFQPAVYSPLGFRKGDKESWALLQEGAGRAAFIGCLPEKDDQDDYPDHIGYEACCAKMIELALEHGKDLQVHTDQANHPNERGTERLLSVLEQQGYEPDLTRPPQIWAVHMLSPSTYDDDRWNRFLERLVAFNVGVICCPSAAIGMRQLRSVKTPTGNSIARVLDLCAAGVPVRMGSDNAADMLSPSTTLDLTDEVLMLSAALRFYDTDVLAHLACGVPLAKEQRRTIQKHIEVNNVEMDKAIQRWGAA